MIGKEGEIIPSFLKIKQTTGAAPESQKVCVWGGGGGGSGVRVKANVI